MFKVIVGCYEQLVIGYSITKDEQEKSELSLKYETQFTDHSQSGSIKCLAAHGSFVAAGSSDETICLYDLRLGKELGSYQGHSGGINEVLLPDKQHLISCSDDGNIRVWKVGRGGNHLKTLQGHKGPVTSFAIHPSGKLGMSVCLKDGTLRTWNMSTSRSVFVKNVKKACLEIIRWSPDGKYYASASSRFVQIYELNSANCVHEFPIDSQILTVQFCPLTESCENCLLVGDNNGNIHIFGVKSGYCYSKYKAHANRVKAVSTFLPPKEFDINEVWYVSVSSDGIIRIWSFSLKNLSENNELTPKCLLTIDTKARLTSVAVWQDIGETKQDNTSAKLVETSQTAKEESGVTDNINKEDHSIKRERKRKREKKLEMKTNKTIALDVDEEN